MRWKTGRIQSKEELSAIIKACTTEDERELVAKKHARLTCFSQTTWRTTTRGYVCSTKNITNSMWKSITLKAQVYAKVAKYREDSDSGMSDQDVRAHLIPAGCPDDDEDDEDDGDADAED